MAGLGNFLGGFADAYGQAQDRNSMQQFRQQELQLQQQSQANAEKRDQLARIDKSAAELSGVLSDTIKHLKMSGADNNTIAQTIQPLVQPLKKLRKSSGLDDTIVDAQVAAEMSRASYDDIMGGGRPPVTRASAPAASPTSGQPAGSILPFAPGSSPPQIVGGGAANPDDDVERFTRAVASTDDPAMRQAFALRLQDALRQRGENVDVKTLKDENQNDHLVFVNKRTRTVTDANGNPWVAPSGDDSDASRIATAIREGRQPPVTTGLYKNAKGVRAELERQGVDLSQMQLEWDSAKKQVASLNGPQMVRYAGLSKSVLNTIDEVRRLSVDMNNSGVPIANKAKIAAYVQTAGNSEGGQLAARYLAAVNTLKEEFANLAQGGYAPTEAAWALANQQINADYGVNELNASLTEVQRLLRYRLQGIPNFQTLGPGGNNRYVPGGGDNQSEGSGGYSGQSGPVKWSVQP